MDKKKQEKIINVLTGAVCTNMSYPKGLTWIECAEEIDKIYNPPTSKWVDVTTDCSIVFRKSVHSGGYYVAVIHNKCDVCILGMRAPIKIRSGYKIAMPTNARISFRIYKYATSRTIEK